MAYRPTHNRPIALGDRIRAGQSDGTLKKEIIQIRYEKKIRILKKNKAVCGSQSDRLNEFAELFATNLKKLGFAARVSPDSEREWSLKISIWKDRDLGSILIYADKEGISKVETGEVKEAEYRKAIDALADSLFGTLIPFPVPNEAEGRNCG